jgi:DNA ligase-1
MGIGGSVITAAVKEVTGVSAQRLKSLWNAHGDPGDVAYEARRGVKSLMQPAPLTIVKLVSAPDHHQTAALTQP